MKEKKLLTILINAALITFSVSVFNVCSIRMMSYVFPFQMIVAISLVSSLNIFFSGTGLLFAKFFRRFEKSVIVVSALLMPAFFFLLAYSHKFFGHVLMEHITSVFPGGMIPALFISILTIFPPSFLTGVLTGIYFEKASSENRQNIPLFIIVSTLAFFAGYLGSALVIPHTELWNILLVITVIYLSAAIPKKFGAVLTVAVMVFVIFSDPGTQLHRINEKKPLIWAPKGVEKTHVLGTWSPYSRVDFYALSDGRLAGLYNGLQWWAAGTPEKDISGRSNVYENITGKVLVIGSGGGYGLLQLKNASKITAAELDPVVVNSLKGALGKYNFNIYNRIDHVFTGDGRAFLDALDEKFDHIIYEAPEYVFPNSQKSFIGMENYLYTSEGILQAVDRLTENGTLVIFHTFGLIPTHRFIKALPKDVRWAAWEGESKVIQGVNYVYTFISRNGSTIEKWREFFNLQTFPVKEITNDPDFLEKVANASIITDNRPLLHFHSWVQSVPFIILAVFLMIVIALLFLKIRRPAFSSFFTTIGVAFMMVELFMINTLRSTLGGYVETAATSTGILMMAVAVGTFYHNRLKIRTIAVSTVPAFIILFIFCTYVPPLWSVFAKILWMSAGIIPAGFLMGIFLPKGLSLAEPGTKTYFYAIDTVGSALGCIAFYLVLLIGGLSLTLFVSVILYITALMTIKKVSG